MLPPMSHESVRKMLLEKSSNIESYILVLVLSSYLLIKEAWLFFFYAVYYEYYFQVYEWQLFVLIRN